MRERLVGKIRQRGTTPHPQGLPQPGGRSSRIALLKRAPAFGHERLKAAQINLARLGLQQITAPTGDQQPLTQHPPQVRHIPLNDLDRARGCLLPPQRIDQAIGGNRLAAMHQQQRQ